MQKEFKMLLEKERKRTHNLLIKAKDDIETREMWELLKKLDAIDTLLKGGMKTKTNDSLPTCPNCGDVDENWTDSKWYQGDGDYAIYHCDCGCDYIATMELDVSFNSKKREN